MKITIGKGKHQNDIPRGMEDVLAGFFTRCGVPPTDEEINMTMGGGDKGTHHIQERGVGVKGGLRPPRGVVLHVQSRSNDKVRIVNFNIPQWMEKLFGMTLSQIYDRMRLVADGADFTVQQPVVVPPVFQKKVSEPEQDPKEDTVVATPKVWARINGVLALLALEELAKFGGLEVINLRDFNQFTQKNVSELINPRGVESHLRRLRHCGLLLKCLPDGTVTTEDKKGYGRLNQDHPQVIEVLDKLTSATKPAVPATVVVTTPATSSGVADVDARLAELDVTIKKTEVDIGQCQNMLEELRGQLQTQLDEREALERERVEKVEEAADQLLMSIPPELREALKRKLQAD